jgi:hypothetical protein
LAAEMANKTTQPPLELPTWLGLTGSLTLMAQTVRYSDPNLSGAEHIGFHYDALDYTVANAVLFPGATLNVLPGTAIGLRGDARFGFVLLANASVQGQGTPNRPTVFTEAAYVQDQPVLPDWDRFFARGWYWSLVPLGFFIPQFSTPGQTDPLPADYPAPSLNFRFSQFHMSPGNFHFAAGLGIVGYSFNSRVNLSLQDCSFYGGEIVLGEPYDPDGWILGPCQVSLKNNLFDRVGITLDPSVADSDPNGDNPGPQLVDMAFEAYNNLFRGGPLLLAAVPASTGPWLFRDNLFDQAPIWQDTFFGEQIDYDYNAYWRLSSEALASWNDLITSLFGQYIMFEYPGDTFKATFTQTLTGNGSHDVMLNTAPAYWSGAFGNFYLLSPSPLLHNAGSRSPAAAGLYHYTSGLETREGDKSFGRMVDIGFHYIVDDGAGHPLDTDHDGIPDYVENWHGDGIYANHTDTETDWQNAHTTAGVADSVNPLYDDVDLSNDGIPGRIKQVLGRNPAVFSPLQLTQIITGEEPQILTFDTGISSTLFPMTIGSIKLFVDGTQAPIQGLDTGNNGTHQISWNTIYNPSGQHIISASLALNQKEARSIDDDPLANSGMLATQCVGPIMQVYTGNPMYIPPQYARYDSSGYLPIYALEIEPGSTVTFDFADQNSNPIASKQTTASADGTIDTLWDLTKSDGTQYSGPIAATVTAQGSTGAPPQQIKLFWCDSHITDGSFDIAYAYEDKDHGFTLGSAYQSTLKTVIQSGVISPLFLNPDPIANPNYQAYTSTFNSYPATTDPAHLQNDTQAATLVQDLKQSGTRNFHFDGHGNSRGIGNAGWAVTDASDVSIFANQLASELGNRTTKYGYTCGHPYRFVFLNACHTGERLELSQAFGFLGDITRDDLNRNPYLVQGCLQWIGGQALPESNADLIEMQKALVTFYSAWMSEQTLQQCLQLACSRQPYGQNGLTLNWPLNKPVHHLINFGYGIGFFWVGYDVAPMPYIHGYPGITRSSFK